MKMTFEQQLVAKLDRLIEDVSKLNERIRVLEETQRTTQPYIPGSVPYQPHEWPLRKCTKCGIDLNHVMGYCCPQAGCPTGLGPVMCKAET